MTEYQEHTCIRYNRVQGIDSICLYSCYQLNTYRNIGINRNILTSLQLLKDTPLKTNSNRNEKGNWAISRCFYNAFIFQ